MHIYNLVTGFGLMIVEVGQGSKFCFGLRTVRKWELLYDWIKTLFGIYIINSVLLFVIMLQENILCSRFF